MTTPTSAPAFPQAGQQRDRQNGKIASAASIAAQHASFLETQSSGTTSSSSTASVSTAPSVSTLNESGPETGKGGGALRSINQKFKVNPSNGTFSLSIPLPVSSSRSGFEPSLELAYDSGNGNGPFGIGWGLSIESITRKTSKQIPKYEGSDVFVLSSADDLVPVEDPLGQLQDGYIVKRYRPRIEDDMHHIECWAKQDDPGNIFWRTISATNVMKIFGRTDESRIFEIAGTKYSNNRIFSWLLCESYDPFGNAIVLSYKTENEEGIESLPSTLTTCEFGRDQVARTRAKYIKSIKYGNRAPSRDLQNWEIIPRLKTRDWMFEVIFDYGDHDSDVPASTESQTWAIRKDFFSTYSSGFEIRSYRLCRRMLMFHHFPDILGKKDYLVASNSFAYDETPVGSFLKSITASGHIWNESDGYINESTAPFTFEYTKLPPEASLEIKAIKPRSLQTLLANRPESKTQWIDLNGEGAPGLLVQINGAWYYQRNEIVANAELDDGEWATELVDGFGPVRELPVRPSGCDYRKVYFQDLDGNGRQDMVGVDEKGRLTGYVELVNDDEWTPFNHFPVTLNLDSNDKSIRKLDLTGSGRADIAFADNETCELIWHESLGKKGFGPEKRSHGFDTLPHFWNQNEMQTTFLADMTGDGLTDIVQVSNGSISYWPNMGHGRFGAEITMNNSPCLDVSGLLNPERIHMLDVDGSGTADLVYLPSKGGAIFYYNQCGNGWSEGVSVPCFPQMDNQSSVSVLDLLGKGTSCLCWIGPDEAGTAELVINYLDLAAGNKPHLLKSMCNNIGLTTSVSYLPSTKFYLQDEKYGRPWLTKLPFPVHVVSRVVEKDDIACTTNTTKYAYHDGYYDGYEREFRGFGMVESWESEAFSFGTGRTYRPPTCYSKLWFHNGAPDPNTVPLGTFGHPILESNLPAGLSSLGLLNASRAMNGKQLRSEIYGDDKTDKSSIPHSVTEHNYIVSLVQKPKSDSLHGIFKTHPKETLTLHYERAKADPRIEHELILERNDFGDVTKSLRVQYGRKQSDLIDTAARALQGKHNVTYYETKYTNAITTVINQYYKPIVAEAKQFHVLGLKIDGILKFEVVQRETLSAFTPSSSVYTPSSVKIGEKTLIPGKATRVLYRSGDLTRVLDLGVFEPFSVVHQTLELVLTPPLQHLAYGDTDEEFHGRNLERLAQEGGYVDPDDNGSWWAPSSQTFYGRSSGKASQLGEARRTFFIPTLTIDPFGNKSLVELDNFFLLPIQSTDAVGKVTKAENDYRVLKPVEVTDTNENRIKVLVSPLGEIAALARMGKVTESKGDLLDKPKSIHNQETLRSFLENPAEEATRNLLGSASKLTISCRDRLDDPTNAKSLPTFQVDISRTRHVLDEEQDGASETLLKFTYFDGRGKPIQEATLTSWEPGKSQWCFSGSSIRSSDGNVVASYQPFFSSTHFFIQHTMINAPVTTNFFDAMRRNVGTLSPDHTWSKSVFESWSQRIFDAGDTISISDPRIDSDIGHHFLSLEPAIFLPSWKEINLAGTILTRTAVERSSAYADSLTAIHYDSCARIILLVEKSRLKERSWGFRYDLNGNKVVEIDSLGRIVQRSRYSLAKKRILVENMDTGARVLIQDCLGQPMIDQNEDGASRRFEYDNLRRLVKTWVLEDEDDSEEILWAETIFGDNEEDFPFAAKKNLRGRVSRVYDQSGVRKNLEFDFKGNCLASATQFATNYKTIISCTPDMELESQVHSTSTAYDAIDRPWKSVDAVGGVTHRTFDLRGNLSQVKTTSLREVKAKDILKSMKYSADGKLTQAEYGNTSRTLYSHDVNTRQILNKRTWRDDGKVLEDIKYTYDCLGRTSHVEDAAIEPVYFKNQKVKPENDYWYDGFGRLLKATGREMFDSSNDGRLSANSLGQHTLSMNGEKLVQYTEAYEYDDADNILKLQHMTANQSMADWTREYHYEEKSFIEPAKEIGTNRLSWTKAGGVIQKCAYDGSAGSAGCVTSMSGYSKMLWDPFHRLRASARQKTDDTPESSWFVYDSNGHRVRKVTERFAGKGMAPTRLKETLYIDCCEIYRTFKGDGVAVDTERHTSLINDQLGASSPIALTETDFLDQSTKPLLRYSLSRNLEVDDKGQVISYEEYTPFGSTTLVACRSGIEAPSSYRYASYKRDSETGLYYCNARYYAPWLGRWMSPDPLDTADGLNVYCYVGNDPINWIDPMGTMHIVDAGMGHNAVDNENPVPPRVDAEEGAAPPPPGAGGDGAPEVRGCRYVMQQSTAILKKTFAPDTLSVSVISIAAGIGFGYAPTPDDWGTKLATITAYNIAVTVGSMSAGALAAAGSNFLARWGWRKTKPCLTATYDKVKGCCKDGNLDPGEAPVEEGGVVERDEEASEDNVNNRTIINVESNSMNFSGISENAGAVNRSTYLADLDGGGMTDIINQDIGREADHANRLS